MWHNKLDACQQNNLDFIIHVTTCNPFVFTGCGEYNQISGSTVTLNYTISLQPIFHLLGKTYCLILLNTPPTTSPPFFLSHYKMILFCATLVIFNGDNEYLTWERLTYPDGLSSTAKMRTASLTNGMCVSVPLQSGNPTQEDPSIWTHWFKHPHAQMQAHNMHLYELLRHVYSGSMEHRGP